jgi:hypothetical protein
MSYGGARQGVKADLFALLQGVVADNQVACHTIGNFGELGLVHDVGLAAVHEWNVHLAQRGLD